MLECQCPACEACPLHTVATDGNVCRCCALGLHLGRRPGFVRYVRRLILERRERCVTARRRLQGSVV